MHIEGLTSSTSPQILLGDVIAERCFTLHQVTGESRLIWVRLGRPVATDQNGAPQEGVEK